MKTREQRRLAHPRFRHIVFLNIPSKRRFDNRVWNCRNLVIVLHLSIERSHLLSHRDARRFLMPSHNLSRPPSTIPLEAAHTLRIDLSATNTTFPHSPFKTTSISGGGDACSVVKCRQILLNVVSCSIFLWTSPPSSTTLPRHGTRRNLYTKTGTSDSSSKVSSRPFGQEWIAIWILNPCLLYSTLHPLLLRPPLLLHLPRAMWTSPQSG